MRSSLVVLFLAATPVIPAACGQAPPAGEPGLGVMKGALIRDAAHHNAADFTFLPGISKPSKAVRDALHLQDPAYFDGAAMPVVSLVEYLEDPTTGALSQEHPIATFTTGAAGTRRVVPTEGPLKYADGVVERARYYELRLDLAQYDAEVGLALYPTIYRISVAVRGVTLGSADVALARVEVADGKKRITLRLTNVAKQLDCDEARLGPGACQDDYVVLENDLTLDVRFWLNRCAGRSVDAPGECQGAGTCDARDGSIRYSNAPDGQACDDGDACTQVDGCLAGSCAGGSPVVCTASDVCHDAGVCDPATGQCSDPPKAEPPRPPPVHVGSLDALEALLDDEGDLATDVALDADLDASGRAAGGFLIRMLEARLDGRGHALKGWRGYSPIVAIGTGGSVVDLTIEGATITDLAPGDPPIDLPELFPIPPYNSGSGTSAFAVNGGQAFGPSAAMDRVVALVNDTQHVVAIDRCVGGLATINRGRIRGARVVASSIAQAGPTTPITNCAGGLVGVNFGVIDTSAVDAATEVAAGLDPRGGTILPGGFAAWNVGTIVNSLAAAQVHTHNQYNAGAFVGFHQGGLIRHAVTYGTIDGDAQGQGAFSGYSYWQSWGYGAIFDSLSTAQAPDSVDGRSGFPPIDFFDIPYADLAAVLYDQSHVQVGTSWARFPHSIVDGDAGLVPDLDLAALGFDPAVWEAAGSPGALTLRDDAPPAACTPFDVTVLRASYPVDTPYALEVARIDGGSEGLIGNSALGAYVFFTRHDGATWVNVDKNTWMAPNDSLDLYQISAADHDTISILGAAGELFAFDLAIERQTAIVTLDPATGILSGRLVPPRAGVTVRLTFMDFHYWGNFVELEAVTDEEGRFELDVGSYYSGYDLSGFAYVYQLTIEGQLVTPTCGPDETFAAVRDDWYTGRMLFGCRRDVVTCGDITGTGVADVITSGVSFHGVSSCRFSACNGPRLDEVWANVIGTHIPGSGPEGDPFVPMTHTLPAEGDTIRFDNLPGESGPLVFTYGATPVADTDIAIVPGDPDATKDATMHALEGHGFAPNSYWGLAFKLRLSDPDWSGDAGNDVTLTTDSRFFGTEGAPLFFRVPLWAYGFHMGGSGDVCEPNRIDCSAPHGIGFREWDPQAGYGACDLACYPNTHLDAAGAACPIDDACLPPGAPCAVSEGSYGRVHVYDRDQLEALIDPATRDLEGNILLAGDLDYSGVALPSTTVIRDFTGALQGAQHVVSDLTANAFICDIEAWSSVDDLVLVGRRSLADSNNPGCASGVAGLALRNFGYVRQTGVEDSVLAGTQAAGVVQVNRGDVYRAYLSGSQVTGEYSTGGIVGEHALGSVNECRVDASTITGTQFVGGAVGYMVSGSYQYTWAGSVHSSQVRDSIVSGQGLVGGIVGYDDGARIWGGTVRDVTVTGDAQVGGVVGQAVRGGIIHAVSIGSASATGQTTVDGNIDVGGVAGKTHYSTIENCSGSQVAVSGVQRVGGFTGNHAWGWRDEFETIRFSHIDHFTIAGDYDVGGLVGGATMLATLSTSIATSSVTGIDRVGQLFGVTDRVTLRSTSATDVSVTVTGP